MAGAEQRPPQRPQPVDDGQLRIHLTAITTAATLSELHDKGRADMGSSGKKRTTMAKLTRESRLRERRLDKQAKKEARKQAPAHDPGDTLNSTTAESAGPSAE